MLVTVNFGAANTGASVYYTLLSSVDKSVVQSRRDTGVTELDNGIYGVVVADATLAGTVVLWDIDATAKIAVDDASGMIVELLTRTPDAAAGATGGLAIVGSAMSLTAEYDVSAADVADAVLDELVADHPAAGTLGKTLIDILTTVGLIDASTPEPFLAAIATYDEVTNVLHGLEALKALLDSISEGGSQMGPGADRVTLSLGAIAGGAEVWVTTDVTGLSTIASGVAGDLGTIAFDLDAGTTYYRWAKKPGVNFTNPHPFIAVADA